MHVVASWSKWRPLGACGGMWGLWGTVGACGCLSETCVGMWVPVGTCWGLWGHVGAGGGLCRLVISGICSEDSAARARAWL